MPMSRFWNKDEVLKTVTKDDVIKICKALGSTHKEDGNGALIFNTKICHGGKSEKLYYYHDPNPDNPDDLGKRFHCYTCGSTYDLIELVQRGFKQQGRVLSWYQALSFIVNTIGYAQVDSQEQLKTEALDDSISDEIRWMQHIRKKQQGCVDKNYTSINENILELFCYFPMEEWLQEGISEASMQKYEIGYFDRDDAIIIPHRHWKDNSLIGIRKRNLNEQQIENAGKYMPITIEGKTLAHSLGGNLYGLNCTKDAVQKTGKLVLFEAEKSVLLADTYFGVNNFTCATCGSNLTKQQCNIIKHLNVREVMIAYDREYKDPFSFEAQAYVNKLVLLAEPLLLYVDVYLILDNKNRLDLKDSPIDKGKDVFLELMKEKIKVTPEMVKSARDSKKK